MKSGIDSIMRFEKGRLRLRLFTVAVLPLLAFLSCGCFCLCGCAALESPLASALESPRHVGLTLPGRHTLARGQLIFHSDFSLEEQDALLNEISASHNELGCKLGLPPSDEPVHVYIFETAEKYSTFMRVRRPGFPRTRAGFNETEHQMEIYVQWGEHMARDLRHEFVHAYIHSVVPAAPLWLDEGLAEYFEVPHSADSVVDADAAGMVDSVGPTSRGSSVGNTGLKNQEHLLWLTKQLNEGHWQPDLQRLESIRPGDTMTRGDYAESWAWVHYLLSSGDRARHDLIIEHLRHLRQHGGTQQPLSAVLARLDQRASDGLIMHIGRLSQND